MPGSTQRSVVGRRRPARVLRALLAGAALPALLAATALPALLAAGALPAGSQETAGALRDREDDRRGGQEADDRGDEYFRRGYFQEAAWAYGEAGRSADRERALDTLRRILLSAPLGSRAPVRDILEPGTNDRARLLDFAGGVSGFFKPEGSLLRCLTCDVRYEAAAWKIDSVVGFDLVPMTVLGRVPAVVLDTLSAPAGALPAPDRRSGAAAGAREARGSVQYFVRDARKAYAAFSPGPGYVPVEAHKSDRLRLFDALVGNADRHGGNWLVRATGEIVAIDNDNIFAHDDRLASTRWTDQLAAIADPRAVVASRPFRRMKALPEAAWRDLLSGLVPEDRLALFLRTREEIVAALEARARAGS